MLGCSQPHLWTALQLLSVCGHVATTPGTPKAFKIILSTRKQVWFHCLPPPNKIKSSVRTKAVVWSFWIPHYVEQTWPMGEAHLMLVWKQSHCLCYLGTRPTYALLFSCPHLHPSFLEVLLSVNLWRNWSLHSFQLFSSVLTLAHTHQLSSYLMASLTPFLTPYRQDDHWNMIQTVLSFHLKPTSNLPLTWC